MSVPTARCQGAKAEPVPLVITKKPQCLNPGSMCTKPGRQCGPQLVRKRACASGNANIVSRFIRKHWQQALTFMVPGPMTRGQTVPKREVKAEPVLCASTKKPQCLNQGCTYMKPGKRCSPRPVYKRACASGIASIVNTQSRKHCQQVLTLMMPGPMMRGQTADNMAVKQDPVPLATTKKRLCWSRGSMCMKPGRRRGLRPVQ